MPAALDDAVAAYRWLLAQGADPRCIAIIGNSAGGGLAFATMLRARDEGVVLPAAAAVVSPWTDLALTGKVLRLNAAIDPVISTEFAALAVNLCLAGGNPRNPYLSPLYGDPAGLSPTLILVGSDDVLRDDAVRMADKMRAAGCRVEVEVWPGMWQAGIDRARHSGSGRRDCPHRQIYAGQALNAEVTRKTTDSTRPSAL